MKNFTLTAFLLASAAIAQAQPSSVRLYPGNGRITFTVAHLFSSVEGSFENFQGALRYDPQNPASGSIDWDVSVRSINTGYASRDEHLRSADYFDADKYPTISFHSQSVRVVDKTHLEVSGKFTLKGVSKNLTVPVVIGEQGLDCNFSLHRGDYGITAGRPAVGEEVEIHLHLNPASTAWFPKK